MPRPHSAMSRRAVLSAGGGMALTGLLAACGADGGAGSGGTSGGGAWSFTDDRGTKLAADSVPGHIVAFVGSAAALWDLGIRDQLAGVFGETTTKSGKPTWQAGDIDVDSITIVGNTFGEFDIEKYAALQPDLLVTHMFEPKALWYVPEQSKDKIAKLAPSAAINTGKIPMTTPITRYAQLAKALGADLSAKPVVEAKKRFHAAADAVRKAVKAKPGLRVMAASADPNLFYVSNPKVNTDLIYFRQLGVPLVQPKHPDKLGYYQSLSWENANQYEADLILLDDRRTALQPKDLTDKPTWSKLPAVAAGQVTAWHSVPRFSYAGTAPILEDLAAAIRKADKLT